jgi:SAM-dependent methyltransferase
MSLYDLIPEFGVLYDAIAMYATRGDVEFYVRAAAGVVGDSPLLELGAGTGRITLPIARAGHRVVGVDGSPTMLGRARAKLDEVPGEGRDRVTLVEGDARDFSAPGAPFELAIAPFRVLQHLTTIPDQLAALESVRKHLGRQGRFVFDVFNPNYSALLSDRHAEAEDSPERVLPDGRSLRRTIRVSRANFAEQVFDAELIYYVRSGTEIARHVQAFPMRWYTPSELEHLLARAGFRIETMYGGFDARPLTDDAPEIVVVARVAG